MIRRNTLSLTPCFSGVDPTNYTSPVLSALVGSCRLLSRQDPTRAATPLFAQKSCPIMFVSEISGPALRPEQRNSRRDKTKMNDMMKEPMTEAPKHWLTEALVHQSTETPFESGTKTAPFLHHFFAAPSKNPNESAAFSKSTRQAVQFFDKNDRTLPKHRSTETKHQPCLRKPKLFPGEVSCCRAAPSVLSYCSRAGPEVPPPPQNPLRRPRREAPPTWVRFFPSFRARPSNPIFLSPF